MLSVEQSPCFQRKPCPKADDSIYACAKPGCSSEMGFLTLGTYSTSLVQTFKGSWDILQVIYLELIVFSSFCPMLLFGPYGSAQYTTYTT